MRATNDDFQAEVFRRSKVFKQKQATRRKQLTAGMLSLCLVLGGFGIWRMLAPERANSLLYLGTTGEKSADSADTAEQRVEDGEGYTMTNAAGTIKGNTDSASEENIGYGMTDGVLGITEALTLETENTAFSPDTAEITVMVTNPNTEAVLLTADDFYIEYTDETGTGAAYMKQPSGEVSEADTALRVFSGESGQFTLTLADYGLSAPLPAGEYAVWLCGFDCESAVFTVEAD